MHKVSHDVRRNAASACLVRNDALLFIAPNGIQSCRLTPGSSVIAPGAQHTRRLFDREPPNRQAEPLVLAQLAARTLRALGAELQSARDGADSAREAGMPAGGDECQAAAALAAGFTDAVEGLAAVVRAAQALQVRCPERMVA